MRGSNYASVQHTFRAEMDRQLYAQKTRFSKNDPQTSLRTTLFHLASQRTGPLGTNDRARLRLPRCPNCMDPRELNPVEVRDVPHLQTCPACGEPIYPADCLRVWEVVNEYQSNQEAIGRFMMIAEHLLAMHYIRYLYQTSPSSLAELAVIIDGPLAIFGNAAWLHGPILRFLHEVNQDLVSRGMSPVLVIGLQKTGQVVDHCKVLDPYIEPGRLLAIGDEYRYQHIFSGRDPSENGFGAETYYGQDFIYKTDSGRTFVLVLPYPVPSKESAGNEFHSTIKTDISRYSDLKRSLALVQHFECDLYENALVPVALAHRYTAISLVPGGRVLDVLTRSVLESSRS